MFQTGIWTELYKIEDTFLKPLRVGINMSRAHYERELHNTMEKKKSRGKGCSEDLFKMLGIVVKSFNLCFFFFFTEPSVSVSVGDEKLPNMATDSQIQVSGFSNI